MCIRDRSNDNLNKYSLRLNIKDIYMLKAEENLSLIHICLRISVSGGVLRGSDREQTVLLKKGVDRGALPVSYTHLFNNPDPDGYLGNSPSAGTMDTGDVYKRQGEGPCAV